MNEVTIQYGQNIFDVCAQKLGDATRAMEVAVLNGISVTDTLQAGTKLLLPAADDNKRSVLQVFSVAMNLPANGYCSADAVNELAGIGYWIVGYNFKVS